MSPEQELREIIAIFQDCVGCNKAVLAALEAGTPPLDLAELFQQKAALLARLEAFKTMPVGFDPALTGTYEALQALAQAQMEAAKTESQISAALLPHIPYHGKRLNPYQQNGIAPKRNSLETQG